MLGHFNQARIGIQRTHQAICRRRLHRVAESRGLNDRNRQLRLPLQAPPLLESPFATSALLDSPLDPQGQKPMQKTTPAPSALLTQIHHQRRHRCRFLQPQPLDRGIDLFL